MTCGKIGFDSRKEAKSAMKKWNREGRQKGSSFHGVHTIYFCNDCSAFHLSHYTKTQNRAIQIRMKRKQQNDD